MTMGPGWYEKGQSEPELWQLETLLHLVDDMDIKWVDTLLGHYGSQTRLAFWTANRARTAELLNMIESEGENDASEDVI